jgi:hypothetical protein
LGFGCQANYRANVDDRTFAGLREPGSDRVGEAREGGDVECDESLDAIRRLIDEASGLRDPGIVDQGPDLGVVVEARFDGGQVARLDEIGGEHINGDAGFLAQAGRKRIEANLVASNQHEVVATACETLGISGADAARGTGDEDGGTGVHEFVVGFFVSTGAVAMANQRL